MKKKKGRKIVVLIIVVVLVIFVLFSCGKGSNTVVNIVETELPHMGEIEEIVAVNGAVQSEETKVYFAEINGKIAEVFVEAGDVVKAGDTLISYDMDKMAEYLEQARLQYVSSDSTYNGSLADNQDAIKELKEAETNLKILNQQIKDEKTFIKNLQKSLENMQTTTANALAAESSSLQKQLIELQKDPVANEEKITNIQLAMQTNQYLSQISGSSDEQKQLQDKIVEEQEKLADYEKYKAEMESQKQQAKATCLSEYQKENLSATGQLNLMTYEAAQKDYNTAEQGITAAFDGVVTEISAIEGMSVGEGTQLVTLANSKEVKVVLSVGKYDLKRIAQGMTADITINDKQYTGKITKIDKMATMDQSGKMQIRVEIGIDNPDDNIYMGIEGKVNILADKSENALLIPVEALKADKTGDFVYVEENGIAVRKDIVCGISSMEYIEVKEGLTINDKVIISSLQTLEDSMPVANMDMSALTE